MLLVNGSTTPHSVEEKDRENQWYRLIFNLGMRGLTPIPSEIETIRIEGNTAKITTEFYRMIKIHFKELYIFDMERVDGIEVEEKIEEYVVYDWFDIKRGVKQAACKILSPRQFVKELVFYPSIRKDGNDGTFKDCYAKSYISTENLDDFEYSETAAKFAATNMIKGSGLRGPKRSVGDKIHHLNLILDHDRRDLHKNKKEFVISEDFPSNIFCCNISKEWN